MDFSDLVFAYAYFITCAFIGWIIECIFRSMKTRKFVNAGMLFGPFVPIYGFGALSIYLLNHVTYQYPLMLQLVIHTVLATILEYITGALMEKIFSLKLWDYSSQRFNLHGRICLEFSLGWLLLILLDLEIIQPFLVTLLTKINVYLLETMVSLFTIYVVIDIIYSSKLYSRFSRVITSVLDVPHLNVTSIKNMKKKMNILLTPLHHFPALNLEIGKNLTTFSVPFFNDLKAQIIHLFNIRNIIENHNNRDIDYNDFMKLAEDIINHEIYQQLSAYNHHKNINTYEHNLKVAWVSYKIGRRMNLHLKELVRGALLHDFYLYDWHYEKSQSGKLHAFEHPREALANAEKHFAPLTTREKDIILKHMWPLTGIPPRYFESFVVCIIDKVIATKEYLTEHDA